MPKDYWAKAKAKDVARRVIAESKFKRSKTRAKNLSRKLARKRKVLACSLPGPVFTFGKYKGKRASQVPPGYIQWIRNIPADEASEIMAEMQRNLDAWIDWKQTEGTKETGRDRVTQEYLKMVRSF